MAELSTNYLGLTLKNPLIVASSHLTATVERVKACQEAGAGAVVLKSLFEEQIKVDISRDLDGSQDMGHADGWDFLVESSKSHHMDAYLTLVEDCKKKTDIPVIASVNCVSDGTWLDYARKFEAMGADALELNAFIIPADIRRGASSYEDVYLSIAETVKKKINIPVAMKLTSHFTDMARMINRLAQTGIDGVVLFNRLYRPDVDIESLQMKHAPVLSAPQEIYQTLQWIALLAGEVETDFCGATGIHDGEGMVKQLLVGARAVQMCSAIIKDGTPVIGDTLQFLEAWMDRKGYAAVDEFIGKLSQESSSNPEVYERAQYVKGLVGIS